MRRLAATGLLLLALIGCREAPEPGAGPQRVRVAMREFAFEPSEIALRAGAPVDLRLRNMGGVEHDWTLLAEDGEVVSSVLLEPGAQGRDRFTLEAGTYDLLCSVEGHAEAGMRGTVTAG